jgi:alcohol dehydrogenase class IV
MAANVETLLAESPEHPCLRRYATIGKTLTGQHNLPETVAVDAAIQFVAELVERLNIPRLGDFGLARESIPPLVAQARKASSMRYNPIALSEEALTGILEKAM